MSEINWDDYYVNVSATECEELEQLTAPEGYVYYIVSMEIQNNLSDTYDLVGSFRGRSVCLVRG